MTSHAIFLRAECALPDSVGLIQEPFCERWAIARDIEAYSLDRRVRSAGWHFFWLQASTSRIAVGRTEETATRRALAGALKRLDGHFNAAELGAPRSARFPGFRIAKVTLYTRHIQQEASLEQVHVIAP